MTANESTPRDGENGSGERTECDQEVLGFVHGATPRDFRVDVTARETAGYVQVQLEDELVVTVLVAPEDAAVLGEELIEAAGVLGSSSA